MNNILLIFDMQYDFIDGVLGNAEAEAVVPLVARRIREFEGDMYYTMDSNDEEYLKTEEGRRFPVPHCIKGTRGFLIHVDILEALFEKEVPGIEKRGFLAKSLIDKLIADEKHSHIDEIELIGLNTDNTIIMNALYLKNILPKANILVNADCCAGSSLKGHESALFVLNSCFVEIR